MTTHKRRADIKPRDGLSRGQHDRLVRRYNAAEQDKALCQIILKEVPDLDLDLRVTLERIQSRASGRQRSALSRLREPPELRSNLALVTRAMRGRGPAEWAGKGD